MLSVFAGYDCTVAHMNSKQLQLHVQDLHKIKSDNLSMGGRAHEVPPLPGEPPVVGGESLFFREEEATNEPVYVLMPIHILAALSGVSEF